jgi:hypothetical protein
MSARFVVCALLALVAAPALAQDEDATASTADITGSWSFSTVTYNLTCVMTGELVLQATDDPTRYDGQLTVLEDCGDVSFEAKESSVAVRTGALLALTSTLVEVTPANQGYLADNFNLRIVNGSLMVGQLYFGRVVAKAEFRRDGMIS